MRFGSPRVSMAWRIDSRGSSGFRCCLSNLTVMEDVRVDLVFASPGELRLGVAVARVQRTCTDYRYDSEEMGLGGGANTEGFSSNQKHTELLGPKRGPKGVHINFSGDKLARISFKIASYR